MISASVGASMRAVNASALLTERVRRGSGTLAVGISQSGVSAESSRVPSLLLSTRRGLSLLSKTAASSANRCTPEAGRGRARIWSVPCPQAHRAPFRTLSPMRSMHVSGLPAQTNSREIEYPLSLASEMNSIFSLVNPTVSKPKSISNSKRRCLSLSQNFMVATYPSVSSSTSIRHLEKLSDSRGTDIFCPVRMQ